MVVYIYRRHFTRWGIEGTLVIKGTKVCDTLEHPTCYFPAGEYEITLFSPILAGEKVENAHCLNSRNVNMECTPSHCLYSTW